MKPFVLRRLKHNVLKDLSRKVSHTILLPMNDTFRKTYTDVLQRAKNAKDEKKAKHLKNKKSKLGIDDNSSNNRTQTKAEAAAAQKKRIDPKNLYTELRKAANHPLLLLRKFEPHIEDIIQEAYKLNTFGGCKLATVRKHLESAQHGNDFRIHQFCKDNADSSPLFKSLELSQDDLYQSPKFCWLRDNLPKMHADGHRVLLFSQWTTLLDLVEIFLNDMGEEATTMRLDGQTNVDDRQDMIDEFNAVGSPYKTFILSTRAGGMGINLTSADTVILHDLDPNPTHDKQAEDRAHRIGQTKEVTVYRLVMEGTVDQHILEKSQAKDDLNMSVLQDSVPDPFADAGKVTGGGSMSSLIERALEQHGM
jgi:SWI/SNF-related matrix-associated actin-dependent regulator 1 of chromatin subfamily A|tara:strand:+ start:139 stop:1230 length:1092 start_codon:yes stop_codon:yes gene_type:complete